MASNKEKAMEKMDTYEMESMSVTYCLNVKKKYLDGKEVVTYTLQKGMDMPKEYSKLDEFLSDCLKPTLEEVTKGLS